MSKKSKMEEGELEEEGEANHEGQSKGDICKWLT